MVRKICESCRKLLVETLGRDEIILRRQHEIFKVLTLSLEETPAFIGCEEEEKMEDK